MDKKHYLSIMAALATTTAIWLFALLAAPIAKPMAVAATRATPTVLSRASCRKTEGSSSGI